MFVLLCIVGSSGCDVLASVCWGDPKNWKFPFHSFSTKMSKASSYRSSLSLLVGNVSPRMLFYRVARSAASLGLTRRSLAKTQPPTHTHKHCCVRCHVQQQRCRYKPALTTGRLSTKVHRKRAHRLRRDCCCQAGTYDPGNEEK